MIRQAGFYTSQIKKDLCHLIFQMGEPANSQHPLYGEYLRSVSASFFDDTDEKTFLTQEAIVKNLAEVVERYACLWKSICDHCMPICI